MNITQKTLVPAKRLAVGDYFCPDRQMPDWEKEAEEQFWVWKVKSHELTERGDYSTFVESDGTVWSERFDPNEMVWVFDVSPDVME